MTNKTMNVQNMLNSSLDDIVKMQRRNVKGGRQNNNNRGKSFPSNKSPFSRNKGSTRFNNNNHNNNNNNNRMRQSPYTGNNNRRGVRTPKNSPAAFNNKQMTPQKSKWNVESRLSQPLDTLIKGRKFRNTNGNFRINQNQKQGFRNKGIKAMSQMRRPIHPSGVRTPKIKGAAFKARNIQPRRNAIKPISRVVNTKAPRNNNVQLNSIHRHLFSKRTNLSLLNRQNNNVSLSSRKAPIERKKKTEIVYRGHTEKQTQPINKELLSKIRVMATLDNLPPPMPQQRGSIVSLPASMSGAVSEKSIENSSVYTPNTERKTLSERFGY